MTRPNLLILIFALMTFLPSVASAAPLHDASEKGDVAEVKRLLDAGAPVNARDNSTWTPLHYASRDGWAEAVKLLLAAGADENSTGKWGRTPLHLASWNGYAEVVKVLLAAGADVNAKEEDRETPLHYASEYGHPETVKILLSAGANVNVREGYKRTPLHRASRNSHTDSGTPWMSRFFSEATVYKSCAAAEGGLFLRDGRSPRYEEARLKAYESVGMAKAETGKRIEFYNSVRRHGGLGGLTPDQVYYSGEDGQTKVA